MSNRLSEMYKRRRWMQSLADLGLGFREAEKFCRSHECACGGNLVVATMPRADGLAAQQGIRCIKDRDHTGFTGGEKHMAQAANAALVQYHGSLSLTREAAEYILTTIWPDAPEAEVLKAALVCRDYGLNPLMKHVYLIGYNNKQGGKDWSLVLGIGAKRLMARGRRNERPYSYLDGPRMMSAEEQERIFGEVSKMDWIALTIVELQGRRYPGYGRYPKGLAVKGADKGNTPQNMAMIRSESAALQKLNPGGFGEVGSDAVIDESFEEAPLPTGVVESTARRVDVDRETGEIKQNTTQATNAPVGAGDPATVARERVTEEMRSDTEASLVALAARKGINETVYRNQVKARFSGRGLGQLDGAELARERKRLEAARDAKAAAPAQQAPIDDLFPEE